MPVATVIIPYAEWHAPLVERAVRSAEAQTVKVDVMTYCDRERLGPGYARNRMVERARTPFVIALDADDWLEPECVAVMFQHWRPGSYVYSDWLSGGRYIQATPCYACAIRETQTQAAYHLVTTLFPTRLWRAIGGYDEQLRNYEDTEFFWRANAAGIVSIHVKQALFTYSNQGLRAAEGRVDPERETLLRKLYAHYRERMSEELCDDMANGRPMSRSTASKAMQKREGNYILVRATHKGNRQVTGKVTGVFYGRFRRGERFYIDPRDYEADPIFFEAALDTEAISPTTDEIGAAAADQAEQGSNATANTP